MCVKCLADGELPWGRKKNGGFSAVHILHPAVNTEVKTSAYGSCTDYTGTLRIKGVIFYV